jgi:FkbM family methyltransferase
VSEKAVWFRPFEPAAFSITGDERDIGVIGELERSAGRYQTEFSLFVRRTLTPDAVAVDGGAHIGVLTVLLASLCPSGRVYAFEPGPESRDHLVENVAANHLDNVVVEDAALFDADGEIVFAFDEMYPAGSHVDAQGPTVPSMRLDSWARARGIERLDLLKLDVEGSELAVLAGAQETIRRSWNATRSRCAASADGRIAIWPGRWHPCSAASERWTDRERSCRCSPANTSTSFWRSAVSSTSSGCRSYEAPTRRVRSSDRCATT